MAQRRLQLTLVALFIASTLLASGPSKHLFIIGGTSLTPIGKFQKGMTRSAFGFNGSMVLPVAKTRFGLSFDYNHYKFGEISQDISFKFFETDPATNATINIYNRINTYLLGAQYYLNAGNSFFVPYLSLQGGMMTNESELTISQGVNDDCAAMFMEQIHSDKNLTYQASFGVRFQNFKISEANLLFIDLKASYLGSGTMTFMTALKDDYVSSHNHAHGNHGSTQSENPETPIYGSFRHIPTGEIHDHEIGTFYRQGLRALGFQVRVGWQF